VVHVKTTFSIDGIHIIKSTSWAMGDLHKKAETIQGGHPPGNKVLSKAGQGVKDANSCPACSPPRIPAKRHSVGHLATRSLSSQTREAIIVAQPLK